MTPEKSKTIEEALGKLAPLVDEWEARECHGRGAESFLTLKASFGSIRQAAEAAYLLRALLEGEDREGPTDTDRLNWLGEQEIIVQQLSAPHENFESDGNVDHFRAVIDAVQSRQRISSSPASPAGEPSAGSDVGSADFDTCPRCNRAILFTAFDAHVKACNEQPKPAGEPTGTNDDFVPPDVVAAARKFVEGATRSGMPLAAFVEAFNDLTPEQIKAAREKQQPKPAEPACECPSKIGLRHLIAQVREFLSGAAPADRGKLFLDKDVSRLSGEVYFVSAALPVRCSQPSGDAEQIAGILDQFVELVIATHPHSKLFREQLESGELERRLKVIGPSFDPFGRVALILKARKLREGR